VEGEKPAGQVTVKLAAGKWILEEQKINEHEK